MNARHDVAVRICKPKPEATGEKGIMATPPERVLARSTADADLVVESSRRRKSGEDVKSGGKVV